MNQDMAEEEFCSRLIHFEAARLGLKIENYPNKPLLWRPLQKYWFWKNLNAKRALEAILEALFLLWFYHP
ncbi:hypothetical protein QFZ77_006519 [Paenibacillus sp. V4I3]|nr:hypothetical protein [Paenibacillus sp. V4I3]